MAKARRSLIPGIDSIPGSRALCSLVLAVALAILSVLPAIAQGSQSVVVTTEVLGAIVTELVGDGARVTVLMESGADPHSWQPSARDAETIFGADVVVSSGLALEEGLLDVLEQAGTEGVPIFEAADHVAVRAMEEAGHIPGSDDPHFWLDPIAMRDVIVALVPFLEQAGIDVGGRGPDLVARLEALDEEVASIVDAVPEGRRTLVTGHESLGYFADRYGFSVAGTIIPGLTTTGEVSARELSELIAAIRDQAVPAVFTEVGTPQAVAEAVAQESGARLVELRLVQLPEDGSYFSLIREMATSVADALSD